MDKPKRHRVNRILPAGVSLNGSMLVLRGGRLFLLVRSLKSLSSIRLPVCQRTTGVVLYSNGNHCQALEEARSGGGAVGKWKSGKLMERKRDTFKYYVTEGVGKIEFWFLQRGGPVIRRRLEPYPLPLKNRQRGAPFSLLCAFPYAPSHIYCAHVDVSLTCSCNTVFQT